MTNPVKCKVSLGYSSVAVNYMENPCNFLHNNRNSTWTYILLHSNVQPCLNGLQHQNSVPNNLGPRFTELERIEGLSKSELNS